MTDPKSTTDVTVTKKKTAKARKKTVASGVKKPAAATQAEAPANNTIASSVPASAETKKHSNSTAIFAIIFSLAALAGVGLSWYQNQVSSVRSESSMAVGITEIGGQVSRIGDSVVRLQEQQSKIVSDDKLNASLQQVTITQDKKAEQLDKKIEQLSGQQAQLLESIDTINKDLKSGSNAYVVDEVAQLLKLANNSLVFASDQGSALNALTVAAAQLKTITDPRYNQVRVKVAEEIALLKNLQPIDVEGLSASLNAIAASVPSLPLANEPDASPVNFTADATEAQSGWRAELAKIWAEIKSAIQIQRVEQAPKPLLAPDQRYFLDQNLQLMLAKADLALLQERDAVFQQSIDSASKWLIDYFDVSDPQVVSVLTQLSDIREQKIVVELPSITASYEALQAIRGGQ